jgi:hypothetical protein
MTTPPPSDPATAGKGYGYAAMTEPNLLDIVPRGEFGRLAAPAWETAEAGERS